MSKMTSEKKHSFTETNPSEIHPNDDPAAEKEKRSRRSSLIAAPWMNKIKPFIYGPKNDDVPDCYNRVRYIRDSCKVLTDLWKTDKDFLNKSVDSDVSKSFKEFRSTEVARNYRSPYGSNGSPSILNRTIDDFIQIHDLIDSKRKESFEQFKKIIEQAKDKHATIRQNITELRENYEKAQRKLETADANLKKFQTRSDRLTLANFDERCRELEDIRSECEQARTLSRDIYATEVYRISSEEHSITQDLFYEYLFEQNLFYNEIAKYLSLKLPEMEQRLDNDEFTPAFRCDLNKHCLKRNENNIAYPLEIAIHLMKNSLREEGIFRIAPSAIKQKKFLAELDLQFIDKTMTLNELGYDSHVPASALKQYLRELPDCLLTSTLINQWNEIPSISTEQGRLQRIAQLINQLPKVNYDNLCYLIGFLSRVAEYSSENKMTPSNLGICIGCSLLYPKDQMSNTSMSSFYASASLIVELMIIHYKQLFNQLPSPEQQQQQQVKSFKSQPDIIPTEFHPKSRSASNENLLEAQTHPACPPPSPGARRKAKAPPPPPSSSSSSQSVPSEQTNNPSESESRTSNQHLTGNEDGNEKEKKETKLLPSKSVEESSLQSNQLKNIYKRFTKAASASSFNPIDKVHRRTPSGGNQLDRPGAPPPHPPSVLIVSSSSSSPIDQSRKSKSLPISNLNNELNVLPSPSEETSDSNDSSIDSTNNNISTPTNENVNVGKLISELNNRMAQARANQTPTTNIRASSIRNNTFNSPGETTDF